MSRYISEMGFLLSLAKKPRYSSKTIGEALDEAPSIDIEPNLILPEQMERGDIYEVGETIVVMNHDDYYDLLCKSWVPKQGEWIEINKEVISIPIKWSEADKRKPIYKVKFRCSECGFQKSFIDGHTAQYNFCPNCGADMRERKESE